MDCDFVKHVRCKYLINEAIAKLVRPIKSPFCRHFSLRLLAYLFKYGLVGAARASMLALKTGGKIIDFLGHSSFATTSGISALSIATLCADANQAEPQFNQELPAVKPIKRKNIHSPIKALALHVNELKKQVKDLREQLDENSLISRLDEMQQKIAYLEENNQQVILSNAINNFMSQLTEMQEKLTEIEEKSTYGLDASLNQIAMEMQYIKSQVDEMSSRVQNGTADNTIAYLALQLKGVQGQIAQLTEEDKDPKRDYQQEPIALCPRERGREAPFFVTGDLLFWKVEEGGMEYTDSFTYNTVLTQALMNAESKELHFNYDFGYRVGLGVNTPYDGWDVYADYTFFRTSESQRLPPGGKKSRKKNRKNRTSCGPGIGAPAGMFFPLLAYQGVNGIVNVVKNVKAHWEVKLKDIDFEIGGEYYLGRHLSFRPAMGFKAAKIDQRFKVSYINLTINNNPIVNPATFIVKGRNEFKGIGPKIGIGSFWDLGVGFSLFGNLGAALLAGWFDMDQVQNQFETEIIDLDSHLRRFAPVLEILIGASWDVYFHHNKFHLGFHAGYEAQYWWRQNQIEQFPDNLIPVYVRFSEDLSFSGLTAGVRFDF
ncbi:MAG TPA: Lpg1974 family pore-forming outer membrane protein [Rhabdochlamydiaceae bacterium]|nr:Lpg1974 family pore-forming outer membrane protein [Rhabdochlamydiaceae bacterium]